MGIKLHQSTSSENSVMYQAIKGNNLEDIKSLLDNGADINAPIWTAGPFAGYTALHVACMENQDDLVGLLISDYKADVNAIAEDGIQSIHLACFYEPYQFNNYTDFWKLRSLLEADASVDVEFGCEVFMKHVKDQEWCSDFGETMTLLTYTVIYKKPELAYCFIKSPGSNLKIKSLKNKTLLMYALEYELHNVAQDLIENIEDPEYLNYRDNDGIPAVHYLLYCKKYGGFRYDSHEQIRGTRDKKNTVEHLILHSSVDKYALLNDDPSTFLPNVAAYKSCSDLLQTLLPLYESMPLSNILYNAMLPIDDSLDKIMHFHPDNKPEDYPGLLQSIREKREECIEIVLKDLVVRQTFGFPHNKEELQLLDNVIATNKDLKNIVDKFKKKFINGELKSKLIELNDKKISLFDFFMQVYDNKKIKLLVRNKNMDKWLSAVNVFESDFKDDYFLLIETSAPRISNGLKKCKLLNKLKKISTLRKAIDLPYELVLDIIDYLNNAELDVFINAFFM